ncbi:hypothetical protein CR513_23995, partial [Mucuna pruriens]
MTIIVRDIEVRGVATVMSMAFVRDYDEDPRRAPLDTLDCKVPLFVKDGDAKSYLEWEMWVDQVL